MPWETIDPKQAAPHLDFGGVSDQPKSEASGFAKSKIGGYVSDVAGGAKMLGGMAVDAITGSKQRTGNYPEFQPWDADLTGGLAAVLGNLSAADGLGYANIMKEWLPDAGVTFDANNNPLIKWRGKTYYANKPGVSGNDAMRLATDMASYWPAAKWASTGTSLLSKGLKGGTASAFANWLQQAGAQQLGSGQEIDLPMVGVAGVAGMGSEIIAPFVTSGAHNVWQRMGRGKIVNTQGAPTPFGRSFVEQVGLDADTISAAMWKTLDQYYNRLDKATKDILKQGLEVGQSVPGQAQAQAQAAARGPINAAMQTTDPLAIPKTMGQQTRGQSQLDFEEMARTGRMGQGARDTMGAFDSGQSSAVMRNADEMQRMAGGGQMTSATPEALGQAMVEGVQKREMQQWQQVVDAYGAVPNGVRLQADPLISVGDGIATALRNEAIFPDRAGFEIVYPRTHKALNDIRNVMSQKAVLPPSKRSFGLMELEQERKAINQLMNGAEGADMTALTVLKRTLDGRVEKVWDDALIQGDPDSLEMLKAARVARTEYGKMFEPKEVEKTVTNTIQKMINTPDIDNNMVVNWIFGTAETGFGNAGLQMTKQLGKIFGKNSTEWHAVREAAMMKMLYGSNSNAMRDAQWNADKVLSKSTGQLLRRMDNFLDLQGSQVMKELFSKPELDQIRRFRYELRQIQPGENSQTLRTGASQSLWMMKMANFIENAIKMKMGGPAAVAATPSGAAAVNNVVTGLTNNAKAQAAVGGWTPPAIASYPIFKSFLTGAGAQGLAGGPQAPEGQ